MIFIVNLQIMLLTKHRLGGCVFSFSISLKLLPKSHRSPLKRLPRWMCALQCAETCEKN